MATIKGKLKQKTSQGSDILHPETEADLVTYSNSVGSTSFTTVKGALDTIISAGVGVTDVQNGSGTSLVDGSVATVTPANIGAVAANSNNLTGATKTKITYDSKGLVTAGADLAVSDLPDNIPTSKITGLGAAAFKGVTTSTDGIWPSSTDDTLVTAKAVYKALDSLPEPMVFMGTLGTNGSITALQPPSAVKEGWTYKVIEDGEYSYAKSGGTGKVIAEEGDVVINNGTDWILIPAGDDDVEDTWREIKVNGFSFLGNGISTGAVNFQSPNGSHITLAHGTTNGSHDITISVDTGYSIPSNTDQSTWSGKQDALATQTAYSAKGTTTKVPQITTNSLGQVTLIEEKNIAFPDITIGSTIGSGNGITAITIDDIDKHKINLTKGSFLTASSITGKTDKATLTTKGDIYYASAASTPARLGIGSAGQVLGVNDGLPAWQSLPTNFYVKNVAEGDVLTTTEYDDFIAGKLALQTRSSTMGINYVQSGICFYNELGSTSEYANSTPWAYILDYPSNTANRMLALRAKYIKINKNTRTIEFGQTYAQGGSVTVYDTIGDGAPNGSLASVSAIHNALADKADKANITAGTYSAVAVNSQGIVTAGGQVFQVVANGVTPDVVTNGLYFEKAAS